MWEQLIADINAAGGQDRAYEMVRRHACDLIKGAQLHAYSLAWEARSIGGGLATKTPLSETKEFLLSLQSKYMEGVCQCSGEDV